MNKSASAASFADLAAYAGLRRMTGLTLDTAHHRLVASAQEPDDNGARYVSSLWEIPLAAGHPVRLTHSEQGETAPVFTPAGDLLFLSTRAAAGSANADAELWTLPSRGEGRVLAHRAGGVSGPVVASSAGTVVVAGTVLMGSTDGNDSQRRATRTNRDISAILHTGMPIRYWDHELGDVSPRLLTLQADGEFLDVSPDAGPALTNADYSISADGGTVATTWRIRRRGGTFYYGIALIDTATGERTILVSEDGHDYQAPRIAPDGRRVAVLCEGEPTYDRPWTSSLQVLDLEGDHVRVELADLFPHEWVWSPNGATLYVSGDLHGRGALVAVDPATGTVREVLADGALHASLSITTDGSMLYALRSAIDCAPCPVAIDLAVTDPDVERVRYLPTPAPSPDLPGRLLELDVPVGAERVHAWLCLPEPGGAPAPVMTWIHGGPFASYNSWSWRWNPWVAVAHGWAVILPDPALSTGYGAGWIERAWPYLAKQVWADVHAVLDEVLRRPDVDPTRLACLGGSFGGYMVNWIAGHTDRFAAIVSHAGLWAADQQHVTTDAAAFKTRLFGRPADHPQWYEQNSPHHFVDNIDTPILLSHGNRDYRVPVSESVRCWWDLVEAWDGDPTDLPHRFLQFTGENHWILGPSNAQIWWHTVLGFCGHHVNGQDWTPSELLP